MKRGLITLIFLGVLISGFSVVSGDEIMGVEVDIFVPGQEISIEVPNEVYLGNFTWGFEDETDKSKVYINNTGNVDLEVTPELVNGSDEIYQNLFFARRTTVPYQRIGNWSYDLDAPSSPGGVESDYFYMKLDLSDYNGAIESSLIGYKADVRWIATQR
jgi:hypothetical protein